MYSSRGKVSEADLMRRIQKYATKLRARLFRNNVGLGWVGAWKRFTRTETVVVGPGDVLIRQARPFHSGLHKGSGDLIGWDKTGRFLSVEVKTNKGRQSPEQIKWAEAVASSGGISIVARAEDDLDEL